MVQEKGFSSAIVPRDVELILLIFFQGRYDSPENLGDELDSLGLYPDVR